MCPDDIKEQIDSGFKIIGTEPEREVFYDLMAQILQSKTGQRLYDLMSGRKKVVLSFYHKTRPGESKLYGGRFIPYFNKVSINIAKVRSVEERLSTLTHELFHALQYKTKTLHWGFSNPKEGERAFILNELEARFKAMEILNELYPNSNYAQMDLNYLTKIDCLVYRALRENAQSSLKSAGQKSTDISTKIARRVAKSEMLKSQLFSITPHVSKVLGENWSNEFESMNQGWRESYQSHSEENDHLTSVILPFIKKPGLAEIQSMIANRLELPVSVFQNTKSSGFSNTCIRGAHHTNTHS